jgi:hypothetical protein
MRPGSSPSIVALTSGIPCTAVYTGTRVEHTTRFQGDDNGQAALGSAGPRAVLSRYSPFSHPGQPAERPPS